MNNQEEQKRPDYEKCMVEFRSDPFTVGKFIKPTRAAGLLQSYFDENGTAGPKDQVYGHTFGLDTLYALINKIKKHNSVDTNTPIRGVRIYYSKSERTDNGRINRDLLLVPVTAGNCDLFRINPYEECGKDNGQFTLGPDDLIVGEGRPCPSLC